MPKKVLYKTVQSFVTWPFKDSASNVRVEERQESKDDMSMKCLAEDVIGVPGENQ